jgi:hypothetical protein
MDDNKRTPDDSYKDLLDIYAREEDEQKKPELKNMVERNRKSGKKPFKLEIKDLDSEFTDAPQKRPPVRRDMPVHHSTAARECGNPFFKHSVQRYPCIHAVIYLLAFDIFYHTYGGAFAIF